MKLKEKSNSMNYFKKKYNKKEELNKKEIKVYGVT